jgi:hypothetical protein
MKSFPVICLLMILTIIINVPSNAQIKPKVNKAVYFDKTPPLRDMELFVPGPRDRSWKDGIIRNEGSGRVFNDNPNPLPAGGDPVRQQNFGFRSNRDIVTNFDGVPNLNQVYPPDTDGDVGPDHYFQMINLSFQIFDKQGNSLYGPADNRTLWNGFIGPWTSTNDGDPVILYDEQADRWVATQFAINTPDDTFWELIAVSETGDPLGAWYRYAFQFPAFNDYPKMGVWPDGYYFSFNMFGADYRRAAVCALDRDAMLIGDTNARMILFDMPEGSEPWSLLPADFDGPPPPAGTPNYFAYAMDDAFGSGDYLSIWALKSDWENIDNSTFEEVTRLNTAPFKSWFCDGPLGACLPQPGDAPDLEALSDRLMYRLQYRNFGSYQAMVTNHTVNVGENGAKHAGIRWYEMRDLNDGNGWFIYQQGTYAPDEHHRWMGSVAMDGRGYIALGFSIVSETKYPSIHYTGRTPEDPPGLMTFYEEEIMAGTGVQIGPAARWGDYSMMSVDPSNDTTFWFTTEYIRQTGQVTWRTRIAEFRLVVDHIAPAEVINLAATANTTNSITLQWTATGNDGSSGTAFIYDIRYSFEPITAENFADAVQAENEPSPSEAGNLESFTVAGLEFDKEYYFAMKVRDKEFNFSGLSNITQATTPGAPDIFLAENSISQKIFPGSTGTRVFTINNSGASDLHYEIHKDIMTGEKHARKLGDYADRSRVADPETESKLLKEMASLNPEQEKGAGDILGIYPGAANTITGMTWAGDVLFMVDMQNDYLHRYDTALQMLTDTVVIHDSPFSISWDGEYLWIGDKVGNVFAYNLDGTSAGFSFSCPYQSYPTLAWDGSHFLTNNIGENNPIVWRIDETGQTIGSFHTILDNMRIWQLVYVQEHYYGHYWFTNNSAKIGQIQVDEEGNGNIIQLFAAPSTASYALAHDRSDLWYGKPGGILNRIDDGVNEVNWLKIGMINGMIPAAGLLDLGLQFDASLYGYGNYFANMSFFTNDPDEPEIIVPVEMNVTGITLGSDTSFCGHLSITLDAGEGFAGYNWSDGSQGQTLLVDSTGYGNGEELFWVEVTDIGGAVKRDSISINFLDCTSIFEFGKGVKVTVYPNPNHGIFEIRAENLVDDLVITLTDMAGKVIMQRTISASGGTATSQVDLTGHLTGPYLIRLATGNGIKVEKVVVL